jgi:hypothetical protein
MSQFRNPKESNPLKHIQDLTILPDIKPNIEMEVQPKVDILIEEKPISAEDVYGAGIKKDIAESNAPEIPVPRQSGIGTGRRGKDKTKRKKKVMSESQLEALAKGRAKSRETRAATKIARATIMNEAKAKFEASKVIAKPAPVEKLDYDTFSKYMDQYSEKKKKKHWVNSVEPHPNKIINPRLRPTPPQSKPKPLPPQLQKWNGNITQYQIHKKLKGNNRWNYGI